MNSLHSKPEKNILENVNQKNIEINESAQSNLHIYFNSL